jgi:hypothetical protein
MHVTRARSENASTHQQHIQRIQIGTYIVTVGYIVIVGPRHMSDSLAAFKCFLSPCVSVSIEVLRRIALATADGNPGCLPLSNPTKNRKWGLHKFSSMQRYVAKGILVFSNGSPVLWPSVRQPPLINTSTTAAEYVYIRFHAM